MYAIRFVLAVVLCLAVSSSLFAQQNDDVLKLGLDLAKKMEQQHLADKLERVKGSYSVVIDYGVTIQELVRKIAPSFESLFPSDRYSTEGKGKQKMELVLFKLLKKESLSRDDVIEMLAAKGYRPAKLEEALALSEHFPAIAKKDIRYIFVLGTTADASESTRRGEKLREFPVVVTPSLASLLGPKNKCLMFPRYYMRNGEHLDICPGEKMVKAVVFAAVAK